MPLHLTKEEWKTHYKERLLNEQTTNSGWEYEDGSPINTKKDETLSTKSIDEDSKKIIQKKKSKTKKEEVKDEV